MPDTRSGLTLTTVLSATVTSSPQSASQIRLNDEWVQSAMLSIYPIAARMAFIAGTVVAPRRSTVSMSMGVNVPA